MYMISKAETVYVDQVNKEGFKCCGLGQSWLGIPPLAKRMTVAWYMEDRVMTIGIGVVRGTRRIASSPCVAVLPLEGLAGQTPFAAMYPPRRIEMERRSWDVGHSMTTWQRGMDGMVVFIFSDGSCGIIPETL